MRRRPIYIAGPMRGIDKYNFPAFDAATEQLYNQGWEPVNPADLDRAMGYDPEDAPPGFDWSTMPAEISMKTVVKKDIEALLECDAIFMLNGWERSKGAKAELAVALWLDLEVIFEGENTEFNEGEEDVLMVAYRLTSGDRQASYGPPDQDFARTSAMWNALFGDKLIGKFEPKDVALAMILLKASRQVHQRKRDNWIDIAGYARCGAICDEVA